MWGSRAGWPMFPPTPPPPPTSERPQSLHCLKQVMASRIYSSSQASTEALVSSLVDRD